MSNEFRPGHPVLFWASMLVLIFVFYSGAVALATHRDCNERYSGQKTWTVWTPGWECGGTDPIQLTRS